jgi:CheY-like chemotaxis protein
MTPSDPTATSLLLVEDNDVEREALAYTLVREGFNVAKAATGDEALEKLRAQPPNLILLDMLLPGGTKDGWVFLEAMRRNPAWATIPVIIVTGLGIASREWAHALGAVDVVRKPLRIDEVLRKIRAIAS